MAVVFNDLAASRHRLQGNIRLVLFCDWLPCRDGSSGKQWQRFVAETLELPKRIAPRQTDRGSKRIGISELNE